MFHILQCYTVFDIKFFLCWDRVKALNKSFIETNINSEVGEEFSSLQFIYHGIPQFKI